MKLGDTVSYSATLSRLSVGSGRKQWVRSEGDARQGIFIGTRTLSDGFRDYDPEYGFSYSPDKHFQAALVVFNERCKPVFVPMDAIEPANAKGE